MFKFDGKRTWFDFGGDLSEFAVQKSVGSSRIHGTFSAEWGRHFQLGIAQTDQTIQLLVAISIVMT